MRRVVVTGMGMVSPVGNDVETCWDNALNSNLVLVKSPYMMLASIECKLRLK